MNRLLYLLHLLHRLISLSLAATIPELSSGQPVVLREREPPWSKSQVLREPAGQQIYRPSTSSKEESKYLHPLADSVGVLFMTSKDEGVHLWLPVGQKVKTLESWVLPIVPRTARITGMVGKRRKRASRDELEGVVCRATLVLRAEEEKVVEFRRADGLVRLFADGGLDVGGEVISYECV